jgi:signal transduction histidine kinase
MSWIAMKARLNVFFLDLNGRMDRVVHSVRFRLTMWSLLAIALILGGFSLFVYAQEARDVQADSVVRISRLARGFDAMYQVGSTLTNPQPGAPGGNPDTISPPSSRPGDIVNFLPYDVGALVDSQGQVLQKTGTVSNSDLLAVIHQWQQSGRALGPITAAVTGPNSMGVLKKQNYYFYLSSISLSGQSGNVLVVGGPIDPDGRLTSLTFNLFLGSLAILLLYLVGGYWLAGRVMRPVQTITHAARQISETDLRRRLNLRTKDELGELADTFDQMLARLEAAFDRQRQFTADASHELRTPLTIIGLETERALEHHRKPEEYQQALKVILNENEYMARLVSDLLTLARMDAGQAILKPEPLDLGDLALEVVERLAPLAAHNGVQLISGDMPEVHITGDRQYLVLMITNLVQNAIKYVKAEHKTVQVETGQDRQGSKFFAWVQVTDNGPGIPPEYLPHLFDRFYRVDKARTRLDADASGLDPNNAASTGLGLAIVQWIARAHGGEVSVCSEVGKGSTFEVKLPLSE